ncbi:MAG: gamma-glutamyl-gamma-aminobutyrate hydrolase family protein, partial [Gemmatimonadales bacterium]
GLRTLAPGLVAVAETGDGLVEGWEAEDPERWLFGVQWHPELYYEDPSSPDFTLFERFTEAARARESVRVS